MPPDQSEQYYGEMESNQPNPLDRVKTMLHPLIDGVKRFGVPKLVGILIILVVAYVYFFVLPKPGALDIKVVELDNENAVVVGAEATITSDGNTVGSAITEDDGAVHIGNLPSQHSLSINIDAGGKYGVMVVPSITLESGETRTITVRAPKRRSLEVAGSVPSTVLSQDCSKTFTIQVKNNGKTDETVEFVSDASGGATVRSESKVIPAQSADTVSFTLNTGQATGALNPKVRIKFTNIQVPLSLTVSTDAPKLDVSPSDINCREASCNNIISVKNGGKTPVSDISLSLRGSEALKGKMRFEGIDFPLVSNELAPGQEAKFALVIDDNPVGSNTAFIDIQATCFTKSLSVKSERQAGP